MSKLRFRELSTRSGALTGASQSYTTLTNFHVGSGIESNFRILFEEYHMCTINTGAPAGAPRNEGQPANLDRKTLVIMPSPDETDKFSKKLREPIQHYRLINGTPQLGDVYPHLQTWAIVEQIGHAYIVEEFDGDTKAVLTAPFCSGSIGSPTSTYLNNVDQRYATAVHSVRFLRVAVNPMFYGTWGSPPAYDATTQTYSIRLRAKFLKNAAGNYPTTTFLRMQECQNWGDERDRVLHWVDYDPVTANESGAFQDNAINQYGYVDYVVKGLKPDARYTAYISIPPAGAALNNARALYNAGDRSSPAYKVAIQSFPQPQRLFTFNTPISSTNRKERPINLCFFSCVKGTLEALEGADEIPWDGKFITGDNTYSDAGETEAEYIGIFEALFTNQHYHQFLREGWLGTTTDDHEVRDNWDTEIVFTEGNNAFFQLTAEENALHSALLSNPANAPWLAIFPRSGATGKQPVSLDTIVPNSKVKAAFDAYDTVMPSMPPGASKVKRSWNVVFGDLIEVIVINTKPRVFDAGNGEVDIEYLKRRVIRRHDGTLQVIGDGKGVFLHPEDIAFIKDRLQNTRCSVKLIVSGKKIGSQWEEKLAEVKNKYIQMAQQDLPNLPASVAESAFTKLFNSSMADKVDPYLDSGVKDLINHIDTKNYKNVFWMNGDPHNTFARRLGSGDTQYEFCISSIGNKRQNGSVGGFLSEPSMEDQEPFAVLDNNYLHLTFDPASYELTGTVKSGRKELAKLVIQCSRGR